VEEEHAVPQLQIEAMVAIPFLNLPIPRRLALVFGIGTAALIFLGGQGLVSGAVLVQFVFPVFVGAGLTYYFIRPEGLALERWVEVLWEYVNLPRYVVWEPGAAAETVVGRPSPRAGAAPQDLWRQG
jgi:hypothetical protein